MSKIGLLDIDHHNYPNLAQMKLSAWHKANGDDVEVYDGFSRYDRVYASKVFTTPHTSRTLSASTPCGNSDTGPM